MKLLGKIILVLLFVAALWLAGLYAFTQEMMHEKDSGAQTADAIVVLTGGSNRLQTGFDLLEAARGKKLFISGVYRGVEVRELLDLWRQENHADLDCCVVLGFEADDTVGNARETIAWMRKERYSSMILVTANYHLKRAALAFKRLAPDLSITAHPVTPAGLDMKNWWRDERYRSLIIREYSKYVASQLLYLAPEDPA